MRVGSFYIPSVKQTELEEETLSRKYKFELEELSKRVVLYSRLKSSKKLMTLRGCINRDPEPRISLFIRTARGAANSIITR